MNNIDVLGMWRLCFYGPDRVETDGIVGGFYEVRPTWVCIDIPEGVPTGVMDLFPGAFIDSSSGSSQDNGQSKEDGESDNTGDQPDAPNNNALIDCRLNALGAYETEVNAAVGSYAELEEAYVNDYIRSRRLSATGDALTELGVAAGVTAVTWGVSSGITSLRAAATGLNVVRMERGLRSTIALANAGRLSATEINIAAGMFAGAQKAHRMNVLRTSFLATTATSAVLSSALGRSDGVFLGTVGTAGDLIMAPGSPFGPGTFLVNVGAVAAPIVSYMNERTAALSGLGVPGLEGNARLHRARLSQAGARYSAAIADCEAKYGGL